MTTYFLADVETTGVGPNDRVVEVAWALVDQGFNVVEKGGSLIDPGCPIPAGASAVHHITNRDVAGKPCIEQYFEDILENRFGCADFIFTAYNAPFDYRFLSRFLAEGTPQLDVLRLARRLYPKSDNHKLATMIYYLGIEVDKDGFHSAFGDVEAMLAILGKMSEDFGYTLWDLFELANTPMQVTTMTFGKHKGVPLKDLPRSYVVWLLGLSNLDDDLRAALEA